ncbi:MAG: phosphoglucomutase/phosphomannomutase family protein [Bacteroidetes bacterium]|nr:phosphoglucomutase/phosphomannomutase family protein [Bacteroidota bacterium]
MYPIKFGTDGWRDIIADTFTTENVMRVAEGTAIHLKNLNASPVCVVGYDCRFGGFMFASLTARIFAAHGIKTYLADGFVSTPMVSLATNKLSAHFGIIITASHNPPSYNGYKIKASYGGPAVPDDVAKVEALIPNHIPQLPEALEVYINSGIVSYLNMEEMYLEHVRGSFNMELLSAFGPKLAYDAMYGAGQRVIRQLMPDATLLHCENNPGFMGRAPEPILKNLPELSETLQHNEQLSCGLATDGDADRIGFFDEEGRFVDSHHIILLLIKYLTEYKGLKGTVVKSFSVSDKVDVLCRLKGLDSITTKIGFKYICEYMVNGDVLIGAEESGGIAVKGHIPERDGVWIGLVLMEYMALTGKSIRQLIDDVYTETGSFAVERYDLHLNNEQKNAIVAACRQQSYTHFGAYKIHSVEDVDGYKFRLDHGCWVMIRPSGTEPVLRVYAEGSNSEEAFRILDATRAHILQ